MILYKHTQYGIFIIALIFSISAMVIFFQLFFNASEINSYTSILIISLIAILTFLLFYKLTITITKEKIIAQLGIGLIKQTLSLDNINHDSIKAIRIPWYYGIGIRITPHGILYNVKTGNAIQIKSKTKTFLVGTDDVETIKNVLNDLKHKNE